jgi:hypothetical protein
MIIMHSDPAGGSDDDGDDEDDDNDDGDGDDDDDDDGDCSRRSRRGLVQEDKRMAFVYTHGLFIT